MMFCSCQRKAWCWQFIKSLCFKTRRGGKEILQKKNAVRIAFLVSWYVGYLSNGIDAIKSCNQEITPSNKYNTVLLTSNYRSFISGKNNAIRKTIIIYFLLSRIILYADNKRQFAVKYFSSLLTASVRKSKCVTKHIKAVVVWSYSRTISSFCLRHHLPPK